MYLAVLQVRPALLGRTTYRLLVLLEVGSGVMVISCQQAHFASSVSALHHPKCIITARAIIAPFTALGTVFACFGHCVMVKAN